MMKFFKDLWTWLITDEGINNDLYVEQLETEVANYRLFIQHIDPPTDPEALKIYMFLMDRIDNEN